jgi:hypothetical protein
LAVAERLGFARDGRGYFAVHNHRLRHRKLGL